MHRRLFVGTTTISPNIAGQFKTIIGDSQHILLLPLFSHNSLKSTKPAYHIDLEEKRTSKPDSKNLAGHAQALISMIEYQEGSIVSRTLIDKKAGTVTLFAFDANQSLSEHTAPFDALVYVFDGEAKVTVSGKPVKAAAGVVTLLPAGKPHAVQALSRFKMMLIMVRQ